MLVSVRQVANYDGRLVVEIVSPDMAVVREVRL
jgi:hypothetical protein